MPQDSHNPPQSHPTSPLSPPSVDPDGSEDTLNFFLDLDPPAGTAQQRKINFRSGRTYLPKRIKESRRILEEALMPHVPEKPLSGPLEVTQRWYYPIPRSRHRKGMSIIPKTTTADLDNIAKLLNDCCTRAGIWEDDRYIYKLIIEKYWVDPKIHPVGIEIKIKKGIDNNE